MPKQCCKNTYMTIPDDEPIFIIRGKDLLAESAVSHWINDALTAKVPDDKIRRAKEHLADIRRFQENNPSRCKMPD